MRSTRTSTRVTASVAVILGVTTLLAARPTSAAAPPLPVFRMEFPVNSLAPDAAQVIES